MAKKLLRRNLVDQIADILQDSIMNGEYKPGKKLPSENELAEEFGTSRLTVRLAIQKLNAMELLETKVGEGSYVKHFNYEQYIHNVSKVIFNPEMMVDIKDFRLYVETGFTILAAQNRTTEELKELKTMCSEFEKGYQEKKDSMQDVWDKMSNIDFKIHMKICEMSHNALYRIAYMTMKPLLTDYMKECISLRRDRYDALKRHDLFLESLKTHSLLYDAIKKQDVKACKKIVETMVNYTILMPEGLVRKKQK